MREIEAFWRERYVRMREGDAPAGAMIRAAALLCATVTAAQAHAERACLYGGSASAMLPLMLCRPRHRERAVCSRCHDAAAALRDEDECGEGDAAARVRAMRCCVMRSVIARFMLRGAQ